MITRNEGLGRRKSSDDGRMLAFAVPCTFNSLGLCTLLQAQGADGMLRKGSSLTSKEAQDADLNLRSPGLSSLSQCSSPLKPAGSDIDDLSLSPSADIGLDVFDLDDLFSDDSPRESVRRSSEELSDLSPLASTLPVEGPLETEADEFDVDEFDVLTLQDLSEAESEVTVPQNAAEQLQIGILNEGAATVTTPAPARPVPENLTVLRVIGHGLHGHVRVVQDLTTSTLYALKVSSRSLIVSYSPL